MEQLPLIDIDVLLEKSPGKGGWTYARLPAIPRDKRNFFGWPKVKGFIDSYEIEQCNLMPMGNGMLFLPVKAAIRKQIGKQEGDYVRIILYPYTNQQVKIVPEDFMECLRDEPAAWRSFQQLPEADQQQCFHWLMEATVIEVRIQRMAAAINNLAAGRPYHS
ncbi:bacteriocin resistance YdeI/OmpD-like protein [Chitinophaga niastensis]|uniref:Bacteriocin resistance YdeI/OmpD-like protein n=1 Tax=Chitinophaga niastensis TaxID=536980 RepID=A0A2P8HCK2_CHINA|nr:YdeI/OmpD-associated family protein [Chitinophaga niastensis]PSL43851.1 bacteriocin resistance YdeI/OmpD-like protein [Chitinophaga niastensis]